MKWCSLLYALLFVGCTTTEKAHVLMFVDPASVQEATAQTADQVCTNVSLEIGFATCKEMYVTSCGVTLRQCSDGASYYCLHDVVCQPKSEADLEEEMFDLEEGTQGQR